MLGVLLSLFAYTTYRTPLRSANARALSPCMALPSDGTIKVNMQRLLGELTFSELTSTVRSGDDVLQGMAGVQASVGPEMVKIGLYYGELVGGDAAGTRILVKCFSSDVNNEVAAARAAEAQAADSESRMRERLTAALAGSATDGGMPSLTPPSRPGGGATGGDGGDAARRSLEAALSSGGCSLAETLAENEFEAHRRVQALHEDVERSCSLARLLGRRRITSAEGDDQILLAFPWKGEAVRMALPTQLPPTLQSWAVLRERQETESAKLWDSSVPQRACQQRGRYVRTALRGALEGLAALHGVGLLHQSLSPNAVHLSNDDDRTGDKVKSHLGELGFCRDARSLELACRVEPRSGEPLPAYEGVRDPLESGLSERAVLNTLRPTDPDERAAFGVADDMREFGMLLLSMCIVVRMQELAHWTG